MATWPTSVATNAILYVAVNNLQTTLSGSIDNVVTTITLASTSGFPTAGGVTIDTEVIFYTGISGAQLTGCTRGADGTTAASHSSGVPVGATVIASHHNLVKDEIIAIESSLDFTVSRAMTSDGTGRLAVSTVTSTELGYLSGVTSAVQTQLNAKAPTASPTFTGTVTMPNTAVTDTSNQLVLGTTRTITITAPTPATSSRIWTLPDLATSPTFAALEGTQTFSGAKTFSSTLTSTAASGNTVVFDTSTFVLDATNHHVGMRTTSPDVDFTLTVESPQGPQVLGRSTYAGSALGSGRLMSLGFVAESVPSGASANNDYEGMVNTHFKDSTGTIQEFAEIGTLLIDRVLATSTASIQFLMKGNGATLPGQELFRMVPISNLGALLRWGPGETCTDSAFLGGGGTLFAAGTASQAGIAGGARFDGTNYVAIGGAAVIASLGHHTAGDLVLTTDIGLTPGNTFTPTERLRITSAGVVTIPGQTTLSSTAGNPIHGNASNTAVAAGYVGEVIESTASGVNYPSTGDFGDLTSISLTAGNWMITVFVTASAGTATVTQIQAGVSTTSGNSSTGLTDGDTLARDQGPVSGVNGVSQTVPSKNVRLSGTTTYYLKYAANFSVSTPSASGRITAIRIG